MVTSPATEDSMAGLDMAICGLTTTQLQLLYDNAKDGQTSNLQNILPRMQGFSNARLTTS